MNVVIHEPNVGYWHETDRQVAISTHYDKQAARETNADWFLINAEPFGTLPGAQ